MCPPFVLTLKKYCSMKTLLPMKDVQFLVLHCSATRVGQKVTVKDIDRWHRARGWKNGCGYHYVIRRDGTIELGRPLEMVGAHCQYYNRHSIGICYEGGLDEQGRPADTRTEAQKTAMRSLLEQLHADFRKVVPFIVWPIWETVWETNRAKPWSRWNC